MKKRSQSHSPYLASPVVLTGLVLALIIGAIITYARHLDSIKKTAGLSHFVHSASPSFSFNYPSHYTVLEESQDPPSVLIEDSSRDEHNNVVLRLDVLSPQYKNGANYANYTYSANVQDYLKKTEQVDDVLSKDPNNGRYGKPFVAGYTTTKMGKYTVYILTDEKDLNLGGVVGHIFTRKATLNISYSDADLSDVKVVLDSFKFN